MPTDSADTYDVVLVFFFFSSRRRHTRCLSDWSSDVCSSDLVVLDRVQTYFGIRSVTAESGRVLLNGNPFFLKMVLDQGYWPESILTPPTDEAIQYDIRMTKEMGF